MIYLQKLPEERSLLNKEVHIYLMLSLIDNEPGSIVWLLLVLSSRTGTFSMSSDQMHGLQNLQF